MKIPIKYFSIAIFVAFLILNSKTFAQVGIGTSTPNDNSLVDVSSTTKGFLPPRMTTTERNDLGTQLLITPDANEKGMLVFDTTLTAYYYWNGAIWVGLASGDYVDLTNDQMMIGGMKTFTNGVTVEGMLIPQGRLMLPMGEISYFETDGFELTIPSIASGSSGLGTNDNMIKIDPGTANTNFVNDMFGTGSDSRLTYIGSVGRYFHIALSFSYSPETLKDSFIFAVAKNDNVQDTSKLFITTGASGDFQSSAMHVLLFLLPNDYIEFFVGNLSTANKFIKIKSFNFVAIGM